MTSDARLDGVVPSSFLRVFQPLDAFEHAEQAHWERYLLNRARNPLGKPRFADRPTSRGLGLLMPADGEHAEVRVVDGRTYLSPRRTRMRVLAAMLSFRETQPVELWDRFVTKRDARRASRELARMRRRDPSAVAFVHESPWHVPIRWFVLFTDAERWLGEDEWGRTRLRYRTTVRKAIRRAEQAVPILRKSDLGPIGDLIVDLHQWLMVFEPHALLELDYGTLCESLTWDELDDDHSARDLNEALEALFKGEYSRTADVYQGVLARWAEVRSKEIWN
jgi:hypothetical protein